MSGIGGISSVSSGQNTNLIKEMISNSQNVAQDGKQSIVAQQLKEAAQNQSRPNIQQSAGASKIDIMA